MASDSGTNVSGVNDSGINDSGANDRAPDFGSLNPVTGPRPTTRGSTTGGPTIRWSTTRGSTAESQISDHAIHSLDLKESYRTLTDKLCREAVVERCMQKRAMIQAIFVSWTRCASDHIRFHAHAEPNLWKDMESWHLRFRFWSVAMTSSLNPKTYHGFDGNHGIQHNDY